MEQMAESRIAVAAGDISKGQKRRIGLTPQPWDGMASVGRASQ